MSEDLQDILQITSDTTLEENYTVYYVNAASNDIVITAPEAIDGQTWEIFRQDTSNNNVTIEATGTFLFVTNLGTGGTIVSGKTGSISIFGGDHVTVQSFDGNWYVSERSNNDKLLGKVTLTGQTTNISKTAIAKVFGDGLVHFDVYLLCTDTASIGDVFVTLYWTDKNVEQSRTTETLSLVGLDDFVEDSFAARVKAGSTIYYSATTTGVIGSPEYDLSIGVTTVF
jgi:hypothetical protein